MKAEERKALQTNSLAQELNKVVEGIKKGPSRSTVYYVALIGAAVLIFFTARYFWRSSETLASQRWLQLDEIVFQEQLESFLNSELKDTPQGRLAQYKEARYKLSLGMRDLGTNPGEARKNLDKGTQAYEDLLKAPERVELLHQEALYGAAKGNEALNNIDKARGYYEQLQKKYPESALGKDAKKQLLRLDSDEGKKDAEELSKAFAPPK